MDSLYQQNEELNRLGKVIEYIELHYNEDINVEMACGLLNLNYFYFCRMFKKVIGRTFVQYLNYVRVSVAEKLLLTTNMPITDIIMETGFSSLSYFNRIFKSHKGCSPSTFRKSKTG
ncbi:MAG: helix-turn-helix transcriptional regulator [Firmicutes bacterium]|nr:helix-turn-helix transcriptional regulator [Bacillota bacterium]